MDPGVPDPAEAGGGGEMGGTSHVPNVAFACSYVTRVKLLDTLLN